MTDIILFNIDLASIKLLLSVSNLFIEMERGVYGILVQYRIVGVRYFRSKNFKKKLDNYALYTKKFGGSSAVMSRVELCSA
jgi:hypothetical protein